MISHLQSHMLLQQLLAKRFITMKNTDFVTWNVMMDIGFWTRLTKKKIEEYQMDSSPKDLIAKFRLSNKPEKISSLSIDTFSFELGKEDKSGPVDFKVQGQFLNTNTIEQYQSYLPEETQKKLMDKQYRRFQQFVQGDQINHLFEIYLLIFADLKKHIFSYQFFSTSMPVTNYKIQGWTKCKQYFLEKQQEKKKFSDLIKLLSQEEVFPQIVVLKNFERTSIKQFIQNEQGDYVFCLADSTNLPQKTGYHTSTFLSFLAWMREKGLVKPERLVNTKILLLKQFLVHNYQLEYSFSNSQILTIDASLIEQGPFEQRIKHKKGSQKIDLKSFMDERTLAREAVDLNIKLMKWRLLRSLDIPQIQAAKCLLFGAGTLGCQLARNLIGWGVKNISFIDYSKVSYSNPVRQTLYEFEDTINGGKPKAETAAEKLRKIYPEINAFGYSIQIPMPGHYVRTEQQKDDMLKSLQKVEDLVAEHDVLFLLLDSRQARWLPTVLANKFDKACITVGLGFDSFVIVRHGVPPQLYNPQKHGQRLCCYFCNDIVTPQNTMKDRTLDQMCTVTKPGLSFISSAYAAELFISLLHHPLKHHAPANEDSSKLQNTDLGKLPHHLRGNLSDYQTSIFYGRAFDQCVACSQFILDSYNNNRDEFMLQVMNDPSFIHEVTGLKKELQSYGDLQGGIIEIVDDDFEGLMTQAEQQASK